MNRLIISRSYSIGVPVIQNAKMIRKKFFDYFCKDHGHTFIPSSPVAPLTDPTLAFVNSGMNQFKGIFLNYHGTKLIKAANSQKCIRIGGKHNDLKLVGEDGYHHTFFEMLGNWSFGSQFNKEEACRHAWTLLTKHYGIDKQFLYVTYFAGDEMLGLAPDLECQDIWLRIGVPQNRIIPSCIKDNFWEMGPTGPCGPCTEIHVDHTKSTGNRSADVNKGLSDLTELWNIVFIEHERLGDDKIIDLGRKFIDTGMGFERLVAFLQNKSSNYDTDIFQPYFNVIEKYCNAPKYQGQFGVNNEKGIDYAYRVLSDHSRAITVALADNIIPEKSHKLRRLMRKTINTGRNVLKKDRILKELAYCVAENLGDVYPELQNNMGQVQNLIQFEEELYEDLRKRFEKHFNILCTFDETLHKLSDWVIPGLINGHKKIKTMLEQLKPGSVIPGNIAFTLYDTYGIPPDAIAELAEIHSLKFDENILQDEMYNKKKMSKLGDGHWVQSTISSFIQSLNDSDVPKTDDLPKYEYSFVGNEYKFPETKAKLLALYVNDRLILNQNNKCTAQSNNESGMAKTVASSEFTDTDIAYMQDHDIGIVLDKTSFYATEGGQRFDTGRIHINDLVFEVYNVKKVDGYVIHFGRYLPSGSKMGLNSLTKDQLLHVEDDCLLHISAADREGLMKHHTAIHLLNKALEKELNVLYNRLHFAGAQSLAYSVALGNTKVSNDDIFNVENFVNNAIAANIPVKTKIIDSLDLYKEKNLTFCPGTTYPYTDIRIVEIESPEVQSREPCCGTHVLNTGHLEAFYVLKCEMKPNGIRLEAVTGSLAVKAREAGKAALQRVDDFVNKMVAERIQYDDLKPILTQFVLDLKEDRYKNRIPLWYLEECYRKLETLRDNARIAAKESEMAIINTEIASQIDKEQPFLVCRLKRKLNNLSLHEILERYPTLPTLIILSDENLVKARCAIPEDMVSNAFNASKWMDVVVHVFNTKRDPLTDIDPLLVAKMNSRKISSSEIDVLIDKALKEAVHFVNTYANRARSSVDAN